MVSLGHRGEANFMTIHIKARFLNCNLEEVHTQMIELGPKGGVPYEIELSGKIYCLNPCPYYGGIARYVERMENDDIPF